jgi:hypothetical protein
MIMQIEEKGKTELEVGDIVIENSNHLRKKRLGEIIFIRSGRKNDRKFELIQLNRHDLSPITKYDMSNKQFSIHESQCERVNLANFERKKSFELGQTICDEHENWSRYGRIVGFVHPDGLYSNSYEKGYNGKDLLECVEISPRNGLPRKTFESGQAKMFCAKPNKAKVCEVLPMDKNGGVRINH